jgi:UDP-N-acetylmuramoyl-tripeptide--D-alanyl-D-alanine ligase
VDDTRLGLGRLASAWRARYSLQLVAITGSNGKTTVKEMLAAILAQQGEVLATQGNLNNEIGAPLTLLRIRDEHRFAVIEMGASHAGEIRYLTRLAKPHVALITNAAAAHLEGFGSIEGVASAKGEIYEGLDADGIAVINADDVYAEQWRQCAGSHQVVSFGLQQAADVNAEWKIVDAMSYVHMHTPQGEISLQLALLGRHNIMNALAATAAALALDIGLEHIRTGLESLQPVKGRMQLLAGIAGMQIINDTYNANPSSLQAALDTLSEMPEKNG